MWMKKLGREKCNLLTQASPLRRPFYSLIPAPTLASLACGKFPVTGISKQHGLRKQCVSPPIFCCWVLDMQCSYAVLAGRAQGVVKLGSRCGEVTCLPRSSAVVSASLEGSSWAVKANALLLWGGCIPFKWCSRYHFDPVVLLVGKLFQYFASPVVRNVFLISSLGLFVASFCLTCSWVNGKKMNSECSEWGLPWEVVEKACWAGHSPGLAALTCLLYTCLKIFSAVLTSCKMKEHGSGPKLGEACGRAHVDFSGLEN